jgi:hypothetical protein
MSRKWIWNMFIYIISNTSISRQFKLYIIYLSGVPVFAHSHDIIILYYNQPSPTRSHYTSSLSMYYHHSCTNTLPSTQPGISHFLATAWLTAVSSERLISQPHISLPRSLYHMNPVYSTRAHITHTLIHAHTHLPATSHTFLIDSSSLHTHTIHSHTPYTHKCNTCKHTPLADWW